MRDATSGRRGTFESGFFSCFGFAIMTIIQLCRAYSAEDRCRELLARLRWPTGVTCPRCQSTSISRIKDRPIYDCPCGYHFSVTAGTVFHDSHLPLLTWFAVVYLLCESKKGMSALQIKRMMGVSYKTAWYLCHRIRHSMQALGHELLTGTVEVDETYVGGVQRGKGRGAHATDKAIVIGIRQRKGDLRLFHAADVKSGTLARYIKGHISEAVQVIITDEAAMYPRAIEGEPLLGDYRGKHRTVNHSAGVYVDGDLHTNTVESAFSLLKRGIMGTWHRISVKHLAAYLDEMAFRFNRRNTSDLFEDTLRHMVRADPLTFRELVA